MPRRLLPAAVVLALGLAGSGCADDVSPAARFGDVTISHEELMTEVEEWAKSPRLVELLVGAPASGTGPRFDTRLVDVVLTNRISFELHAAEFDARDLAVDDALLGDVRNGLFENPADTEAVLAQLDPAFAERLIEDVARQFVVQSELADGLLAFQQEAFADVEVSPRYGSWDVASGSVVPPDGPRPAPSDDDLLVGP